MNKPFTPARRRYMQPLPSRKKHALLAVSFLTVLIAGTILATTLLGDANDAEVKGMVSVDPLPLPPASDSLASISEALPDLLAGEVPENTNPTVAIDALGNAIEAQPTPELPKQDTPSSSGPRTIMIDGAPIDGSSAALVPAPIAGLSKISANGRNAAIGADL